MTHPRYHEVSLRHVGVRDREAIRDFKNQLEAALGHRLLAIKVFGSKVTGRATRASDIDLLVLVEHHSDRLENQVIDIAFDVNLTHGVYISPRVIAATTFRHPVWRHTPFLRHLSRESVRV